MAKKIERSALPPAATISDRIRAARVALARVRRELSDLQVQIENEQTTGYLAAAERALDGAIDQVELAYGTAAGTAIEEALDSEPALAA